MPFLYFLSSGNFTPPQLKELNQNVYQFYKTLQIAGTDNMDLTGKELTFNGSVLTVPGQFGDAYQFSGDGDSITTNATDDSNFGTDDFTIGFWINSTSISDGFNTLISTNDYRNVTNGGWRIYKNNSNLQFWYYQSAPLETILVDVPSVFLLNTWQHIILTRRTGAFYAYVNGVFVGSNTPATANLFTPNGFEISSTQSGLAANAILDDIFVLKGVSIIGENDPAVPFLVPTTETRPPRDYDPTLNNTEFLLTAKHITDYSGDVPNLQFDNLFKQSFISSTGVTLADTREFFIGERVIDVAGSTSSMQFDGTFADLGSEDFTIECFVEADTLQSQDVFFLSKYNTSGNQRAWGLGRKLSGNNFLFRWSLNGSSVTEIVSDSTVSTATSYHVAVTREDTTLTLFIDGVPQTNTGTISGSMFGGTANFLVGGLQGGSANSLDGAIDQIRIIKGEAIYPSTGFTTPQAPLYNPQKEPVGTDRSRTVFWLNADDNDDTKDKLGNVLTLVGNTSNTEKNWFFGSRTYNLDGTGDEITTPDKLEWQFDRVGGFTCECWFNVNLHTANRRDLVKHGSNWSLGINTSNQLSFTYDNGVVQEINDSSILSVNRDYHAELSYDGANITLRLNGIEVDTVVISGTPTDTTSTLTLGTNLNGEIYSVKISEFNKYTSNFSIFPDDPIKTDYYSTDLLVQVDDTYGTGFNWDRTGKGLSSTNAVVTSDNDFFYGKKIDFNGTDSVITVNNKPADYSNDFAIEFEVKADDLAGIKIILEGDNYQIVLVNDSLEFISPKIYSPFQNLTFSEQDESLLDANFQNLTFSEQDESLLDAV